MTLKEILDHFPGGLLITDKESRVLYASAALERRTGFSIAEIVGKKPGELWGGKMKKSFYSSLWQTIGTQQQSFVGEVHNVRKNGAPKDEHVFIVPIRNGAGETEYYAEIHPEFADRVSEIAFGREFLAHTKNMVQGGDFLAWLFQALQKRKDGTSLGTMRPFWQDDFQNMAQFFREAFIAPTEKVFVQRKEDALLVARAQETPEQFSGLYEKYTARVREYFLRRLQGDAPLAEDLTQEVFVRAFHYLPGFRMANASYYTYLLHVAHSVLVNHYRKRRYETISYEQAGNFENTLVVSENPVVGDMEAMLKTLSEMERTIMLFKYRDNMKVKEIAGKVAKTENAVKLILSRSRKKLKKELK